MQVYLPDDLHRAVKERGLPASELLQDAIRAELNRQDKISALNEYLEELKAEVGEATSEEDAWAEDIAHKIAEHHAKSKAKGYGRRRTRFGGRHISHRPIPKVGAVGFSCLGGGPVATGRPVGCRCRVHIGRPWSRRDDKPASQGLRR